MPMPDPTRPAGHALKGTLGTLNALRGTLGTLNVSRVPLRALGLGGEVEQ
jgi:hypothetical protein